MQKRVRSKDILFGDKLIDQQFAQPNVFSYIIKARVMLIILISYYSCFENAAISDQRD